jgi:hypothetical protein
MKGILFNDKYGLESAVLNGTKTRTWREDKQPRYEVGEVVAIKQCYQEVYDYFLMQDNRKYLDFIALYSDKAGWNNKMFVKNELMPHQIRITAVKKCRLQDLTDEECLKEGVRRESVFCYLSGKGKTQRKFITAILAFYYLIEKLNGKCYWESNPDGYAYEFELVN